MAGHTGAMQRLLAGEADLSQTDHDGETPLHVAARAGRQAPVDILVAAAAAAAGL